MTYNCNEPSVLLDRQCLYNQECSSGCLPLCKMTNKTSLPDHIREVEWTLSHTCCHDTTPERVVRKTGIICSVYILTDGRDLTAELSISDSDCVSNCFESIVIKARINKCHLLNQTILFTPSPLMPQWQATMTLMLFSMKSKVGGLNYYLDPIKVWFYSCLL